MKSKAKKSSSSNHSTAQHSTTSHHSTASQRHAVSIQSNMHSCFLRSLSLPRSSLAHCNPVQHVMNRFMATLASNDIADKNALDLLHHRLGLAFTCPSNSSQSLLVRATLNDLNGTRFSPQTIQLIIKFFCHYKRAEELYEFIERQVLAKQVLTPAIAALFIPAYINFDAPNKLFFFQAMKYYRLLKRKGYQLRTHLAHLLFRLLAMNYNKLNHAEEILASLLEDIKTANIPFTSQLIDSMITIQSYLDAKQLLVHCNQKEQMEISGHHSKESFDAGTYIATGALIKHFQSTAKSTAANRYIPRAKQLGFRINSIFISEYFYSIHSREQYKAINPQQLFDLYLYITNTEKMQIHWKCRLHLLHIMCCHYYENGKADYKHFLALFKLLQSDELITKSTQFLCYHSLYALISKDYNSSVQLFKAALDKQTSPYYFLPLLSYLTTHDKNITAQLLSRYSSLLLLNKQVKLPPQLYDLLTSSYSSLNDLSSLLELIKHMKMNISRDVETQHINDLLRIYCHSCNLVAVNATVQLAKAFKLQLDAESYGLLINLFIVQNNTTRLTDLIKEWRRESIVVLTNQSVLSVLHFFSSTADYFNYYKFLSFVATYQGESLYATDVAVLVEQLISTASASIQHNIKLQHKIKEMSSGAKERKEVKEELLELANLIRSSLTPVVALPESTAVAAVDKLLHSTIAQRQNSAQIV
jgi:hypothetical protein